MRTKGMLFTFTLDQTVPAGTKSRRLERQRAQVIDRNEKRLARLQGVEAKAAAADVTWSEQLASIDEPRRYYLGRSRRAVRGASGELPDVGSVCVYTVSSPLYDEPKRARRPVNSQNAGTRSDSRKTEERLSSLSSLRPSGFISVTTGRARRRRRAYTF